MRSGINALWLLLCLASPAWAGMTGVFQAQGAMNDGVVKLEPAEGGQYVHAVPQADSRPHIAAFTLSPLPRTDYVFYSPQEVDALLSMQSRQEEHAREVRARHRASIAKSRARLHLDWPKVVIQNQQVCVPTLAFSDAPDWREHLTCTDAGGMP